MMKGKEGACGDMKEKASSGKAKHKGYSVEDAKAVPMVVKVLVVFFIFFPLDYLLLFVNIVLFSTLIAFPLQGFSRY
jgi:hypothetical protein